MLELITKAMDPYHHHHHHHHHRLNHAQSSSSPFDSSSMTSPSRPQERPVATTHARAPGPHQMGPSLGPSRTVQYPLQTTFNRTYDSESTSPGEAGAPTTDPFVQASTSATNTSHGSGATSNPKRAYRQRRKDPSCDACRERKVKCDATETTSCSECTSRNVRCQFTKETNRRMSSIKQFQDLERQLQQARQQLAHFRSIMPKSDSGMDTDMSSPPYHPVEAQSLGSPPPKRKTPAVRRDFSQVRADLKQHGRGLLQIPSLYRGVVPQSNEPLELPDLPPKHIADRLLLSYHDHFHLQFPILHWPTFLSECDQLYQTNSIATLGAAWGAVFLCVLACGTLHILGPGGNPDGKAFLTSAIRMSNLWQDNFSIQEARMAFLTGVFFMESNLKSASWVWLGSAIRISQDIGLHVDSGAWCPIQREMRRRLWYCIYAWDRILALELGKPLLINDADYDTDYPEPADDEQITQNGVYSTGQSTALLATVHVVRSFQSLIQLLKSPYVTRYDLEACEEDLHKCFSLFPKTFQPDAPEALDPRAIAPLVCLQNARLSLQRHNLTPLSPPDLRLQAINKCVMVARDTARILSRCLYPDLSQKQASADRSRLLAISASTLLCMHIWRCLLLLLFRADYHPAIALVQAASAIGGARQVNVCCGRYIEFFLRVLYARFQQGTSGDFENDEELIAYVSGDLQNDPENNWVWQGGEVGTELNRSVGATQAPSSFDQVRSGPVDKVQSPVLRDQEAGDCNGWELIERSVRYLLEQQHNQRQQTQQRSPQHQAPVGSPSDTSRMTIANII